MRVVNNEIYKNYIKRPLDFTLSSIAIVVLSPVVLTVGILVKTKIGSPVLFKQKRPGLNEKIFTMYKFRTMTNETDEQGELLPDSLRLTKFGKFLRSSSLDELPGLFNILKGDMSIVGPRPLLIKYLPFYREEEKLRHTVRPGLTGLSQVNGRNYLEWDKRLSLDVSYANHLSFKKDMNIIYRTLKKVIQREDIAVGNEHVMKNLDIERGVKKNGNN
ncbi:sugar transferase [Halobacillus sp. A5]|uniref:sugar transferase n=1 Tax=Halobacillus sp. A5 TaxID=2880263 RepID=UPI002111EC56|nr:sugar transferase [Halobacillus sp. A5]